ncbi:hypothetical protein Bhyg_03328 [Pseudolycoriella hygida]|uniref:Uncharacterized protein n=1 Tax=Pseudolycoriella hygida TaxID=35572 RepID=A0A9Q0NDH7_9DIPT|nr:hypothetical protein Bhyg_03328 [Pseudolycoriella hygida]
MDTRRMAKISEESQGDPENFNLKKSSNCKECDTVKPKKSTFDADAPFGGDDDCSKPKQLKSFGSQKDGTEKSKITKSKVSTKPTGKKKRFSNLNRNPEGEELSQLEEQPIPKVIEIENGSIKSPVYSGLAEPNPAQIEEIIEQIDQLEDANHKNEANYVETLKSHDLEDDTESLSENCLDGVLQGFDKDIGALYSKVNGIENDVKEIKRLMEKRQSQPCTIRTLSSQLKEKSSLLPKLPLKKKSYVRRMESDAGESEKYKEQMKLCGWRFKDCTEAMIRNEIKNRFNQADIGKN